MADFGLQIEPGFGFSYADVLSLANELAPNGFNSISVSDHFMLNRGEADRNCLEAWTLLTAIATEVSDIRVGSAATCASYRNPALLARMAATVDHISGGRLDFGIAAGWKDIEYQAYGYEFPTAGERARELEEALQIIRMLWTQERSTFSVKHFSIEDAMLAPKPVQNPGPPVMISGVKPRTLHLMAAEADIVEFTPKPDPEGYAGSLEALQEICERSGRDFSTIRRSHSRTVLVGRDKQDVEDRLERVAKREGVTPDGWRSRRSRAFIGTAADLAELLNEYTRLGVSLFTILLPYQEESDSIKLIADEVIPRVESND